MDDWYLVAKEQWRKAEKTWRTSRSHTNLLGFHSARNYLTFVMNKAHCDYYTNFVNVNSVNQRRLFNASKSLLNISRSASLPLSANGHQLANNFGASFTKKRKCHYFSDTNGTVTNSTFSEFNLLSESEVYGLITLLSKTSCPLDPISQPNLFLNALMCYCLRSLE